MHFVNLLVETTNQNSSFPNDNSYNHTAPAACIATPTLQLDVTIAMTSCIVSHYDVYRHTNKHTK